MEPAPHPPWYVEPFPGESISHYFGRFRRHAAVCISSPSTLGRKAGVGSAISRWEKFRFNPRPTSRELEAMAKFIGIEVAKLEALCPPSGESLVHRSTRLCALCYREAPYHRLYWQFQSTEFCDRHQLPLISRCPACDEKFPLPSEWQEGKCQRCGMKFTSMKKRQEIAMQNREARLKGKSD